MKRMVENSEKIEELASITEITENDLTIKTPYLLVDGGMTISEDLTVSGPTEIYNKLDVYGEFTTSNINLFHGFEIKLFDENIYDIVINNNNVSFDVYNLGTALIISGSIGADKANGDYSLITVNIPQHVTNISATKLSSGKECSVIENTSNNVLYVKLRFNKELATNPSPDFYYFVFLVGYKGKSL